MLVLEELDMVVTDGIVPPFFFVAILRVFACIFVIFEKSRQRGFLKKTKMHNKIDFLNHPPNIVGKSWLFGFIRLGYVFHVDVVFIW